MILFSKKPAQNQTPEAVTPDAAAPVTKSAVEPNKAADTDGTRRRARQVADDNRLL